MKAKIHFIIILLITLISNNLFSQGSGWVVIHQVPLFETMYEVQFVNDNTGFIGAENSKLYKSTNSGLNWIIYDHHNINNRDVFNSIFFFDSQTGFIGGDYGRLFKTTNGGVSIDTIFPGGGDHFHSIFFSSRDTGYMATKYGGLLKTINGGTNWIIQQQSNSTGYQFEGLYCVNNQIVFATGNKFNSPYYQICRTTDGGLNWSGIRVDSANWVYNVRFTDIHTGFVVGERMRSGVSFYEGLIFKTTNGGNSWSLKLADSASCYRSIYFVDQNTGFVVGTSGSSFAKTTNAGETWSVYESYLFGGLWSVYFINANTGVSVGEYRIIRTTNGGEPIGIKPISTEIPESFSLYQNYPNPFNPVTKIRFSIPPSKGARPSRLGADEGMMVKLIIYDILGREVEMLVNEQLKPGTHEVEWDAGNYPSGVYFYKLTAGSYTDTKKMALVK
jgi:photosystem II stability/assembly factor-like uncharacterized protein